MIDASADKLKILGMAVEIVAAHISNNKLSTSDVSPFLRDIHRTLLNIYDSTSSDQPAIPAVPVGNSINNDYIVCLEDGKRLRMLKRYLMAQFSMTPDEYRAKWGLPADYPMVAPAVAAQRRLQAKSRKRESIVKSPIRN